MKTLYLVRHSKSDWGNESLSDIDRPLNARGYSDAHRMSARMKEKGEMPDVIYTSAAIRAISTALIFSRNLGTGTSRLRMREGLYDASADELLNFIRAMDNDFSAVLIVCHNPGISHAVNRLCNASIDNVPTTGIVYIALETDNWEKAGECGGELNYFDYPKRRDR